MPKVFQAKVVEKIKKYFFLCSVPFVRFENLAVYEICGKIS
jgi:hypothetical protein